MVWALPEAVKLTRVEREQLLWINKVAGATAPLQEMVGHGVNFSNATAATEKTTIMTAITAVAGSLKASLQPACHDERKTEELVGVVLHVVMTKPFEVAKLLGIKVESNYQVEAAEIIAEGKTVEPKGRQL